MHIELSSKVVARLIDHGCKTKALLREDPWRGLTIDTGDILPTDIPLLMKALDVPEGTIGVKSTERREFRRIIRLVKAAEKAATAIPDKTIVKKLEEMPGLIQKALIGTPNKWVFKVHARLGILVPYFVRGAYYHPPERVRDNYTPASVSMKMRAVCRGSYADEYLTFGREDLGKTILDVLRAGDLMIETPQLMADYDASMKKYHDHAPLLGEQYLGNGKAYGGSSLWSRADIALVRDGVQARLVMDESEADGGGDEEKAKSPIDNTTFWTQRRVGDEGDEDDGGEKTYRLPTHPIVRAFNLGTHEFCQTHIDNLEPYPYSATVGQKLILPDDHRLLIDTLTMGAVERMDDIVKGKATGIIALCSGKPGTGKTLTAEVYAEVAKRPLYTVQCSQLGTDAEKLEELLAVVLTRATRWRAILLIDEADVYIHERGDDLDQNAIVGVFLRLLEYYSGILFLTTNRDTIIDDAILSRCTAHVRYDVTKTTQESAKVWKVLLEQYGVKSVDPVAAAEAFPGISGRSIRALVRLSKMMADHKKAKVDIALLRWAGKFQDFTEKGEWHPDIPPTTPGRVR